MTDEEKIKAVTAKLLGEFYVGQRVRIKSTFVVTGLRCIEANVTGINGEIVQLHPPPNGARDRGWHRSNLEPVEPPL